MGQVGLDATGTLTYGTYTFDGAYHIHIETKSVYDEAGRIVIYLQHTLAVKAVIADGDPGNVESRMQTVHDILMQSSQFLIVNQKGFNQLGIDTSIPTGRDVNFGPKPISFSWRQIGDTRAVEILWVCEVCLAPCASNRSLPTGILAYNYDITVTNNRHGDTVRVINGYMQVANSVVGLAIENNPETFLPTVFGKINPLARFFRESTRKYNYQKNRVDFTITDTEIATHQPMNSWVTEITGEHNAQWGLVGKNGAKQYNSLSLRITLQPNINPSKAYLVALDAFFQRRNVARNIGGDTNCLTMEVEITENIWTRTSDFRFKWLVLGPIEQLVSRAGLWVPLKTTDPGKSGSWDWIVWQDAMNDPTTGPNRLYGNAQWKLADKDVVVNLCTQLPNILINADTSYNRDQDAFSYGLKNTPPDPETSYLDYYMWIEDELERPTAVQSILQIPEQDTGSTTMLEDEASNFSASSSSSSIQVPNIIQQSSTATHYVWLKGFASRAGHSIPVPMLTSVGGQTPVKISGGFKNLPPENKLGVTIYKAQWNIKYALPGIPSVITALANPAEGVIVNGGGYTLGSNGVSSIPPDDVDTPGPIINGQA